MMMMIIIIIMMMMDFLGLKKKKKDEDLKDFCNLPWVTKTINKMNKTSLLELATKEELEEALAFIINNFLLSRFTNHDYHLKSSEGQGMNGIRIQ